MDAERTATIRGRKVEEYYWNGRSVVYIDSHKTELSFAVACNGIEDGSIVNVEPEAALRQKGEGG